MSHAASQSARRRLEQSWFARDFEQCSAILSETFPAGGSSTGDIRTLESFVQALRPMTAEAAGPHEDDAFAPFGAQRADLFRKAAASNNDLRIALESDAIAVHDTGPGWATALFNYVLLRGGTIGSRRDQLWENVAFIHWAANHLLRHCELDELSLARLLITILNADMHLNWGHGDPSILKLVMQGGRNTLQDGVVRNLTRLAEAAQLTEPEAFLAFDIDGRLVDALAPLIRQYGVRHPNSVALAYFQAHSGSLPADDFPHQVAHVPCMVVGKRTAFIVAGDFCPPRLCRSLQESEGLGSQGIHLTWWLNVMFPREQLGNAAFITSRIPPFVRGLLAHGKATLVLAATGEGSWFHPRWVDWMEGLAEALACRPDQVVYLSQNTRFPDDYRVHRAEMGLRRQFGTVPLNSHLLIEGMRTEPSPAAPTKHFLCFNQRPHLHRAALLLGMQRDGLLERAHMAFNQSITADLPLSGQSLASWLAMPAGAIDALIEATEPMLPLRLDLSGHGVTTAVDAGYVDHFSARLFADAAIYLVTETEMGGPEMCRYTEKTVKGLAAEIPFIVFGNAGVLASLRALGFRTFAPLIDESYDAIADPVARFKMAYAEVRRLGAMPLATLVGLRQVLQPVLAHNRATLLSIDTIMRAQLVEGLEAVAASG